jgi:hypothetical protein
MKQLGRRVIVSASDVRRCGKIVCNDLPNYGTAVFPPPANIDIWAELPVREPGRRQTQKNREELPGSVKMPNIYRDKHPNHFR